MSSYLKMNFFKSFFISSSPKMSIRVNFDILRRCVSIVHWLNDGFYHSFLTQNLDDFELATGLDETLKAMQRHVNAITTKMVIRRLGEYREWGVFDAEDEHSFHSEAVLRTLLICVDFDTYR